MSGFARASYWKTVCLLVAMLAGLRLSAAELHAVTDSMPPMNYEEQGVVTGFATELLQATLQDAGLQASFQLLPWARAYQSVLTQPDTVLYPTTRNAEREALFEWLGPIAPREIFVYKLRARRDIRLGSVSDAAAYRVGLIREYASSKEFLKMSGIAEDKIDFAPSEESNMRKLLLGRIDLLLSDEWSAAYWVKTLHRKNEELEPVLLFDRSYSYYYAFNKHTDPAALAKLRAALARVRQSGRVEQLREKYLH